MSNIAPVTTLYICTFIFLPTIFCVVWLLPNLLNSQLFTKVIVCAGVLAIFVPLTVWLIDKSPVQIRTIKFVTIIVMFFWGIIVLFVEGYYDVRLRVTLGAKYFNESSRFQTRLLGYDFVGVVISSILGVMTGWIVVTFGSSISGLFIAIVIGAIYGGICGGLLDLVTTKM